MVARLVRSTPLLYRTKVSRAGRVMLSVSKHLVPSAHARGRMTRSFVPQDDPRGARGERRSTRRVAPRVRRAQPGQAIIEFALVLPVMLLIVFGAVDVGRVFFDYVGLRNAAMEGAIYGSRNLGASEADIDQRVQDHFFPDPGPASGNITSTRSTCTNVGQDGFVSVTITQEFRPITLDLLQFAGPGSGWVFTVNPTAQARCMT